MNDNTARKAPHVSRTPCQLAKPPAPKIRVIPEPKRYEWSALVDAMKTRKTVVLEGHTGIINGIQAEDGSGRCWLVYFHNRTKPIFVRTN